MTRDLARLFGQAGDCAFAAAAICGSKVAQMDETPEELAQIRHEAENIDPQQYRKRYRALMTLLAAIFCAVVVGVAIHMVKASRNPCERVRDHFCHKAPDPAKCASYRTIFKESVEDESPKMRGVIRDQCLTKIKRLQEEDGVAVE